jgi:DNA-binding CsgD family transcriptional regulator
MGMQRIYQVGLGTKCDILTVEPSLGERLLDFKTKTKASVVCFQAMLRDRTDHHFVMTTAFKRFFDAYVDERVFLVDPVFQQCSTTKTPFEWSPKPTQHDSADKRNLFGNLRWLTLPVCNERVIACVHVGSDADEETWRGQIADFIWHGMTAGDDIVTRLLQLRSKDFVGSVLTDVQIDYLALLAAGKDIDDIVKITRRDHRAVNRQLHEALARLNARTQSQAVVKALSLGILPSPH